jgi:cytochrome c peroxidase
MDSPPESKARRKRWLAVFLVTVSCGLGRAQSGDVRWDDAGATNLEASRSQEPIKPIPTALKLDPRKVALGSMLFHEVRLSEDNSISCASCHSLATGGVDRLARSLGIGNAEGPINAPTVFNSGFNFKQFWDGRAENLEGQVDGPTQAADEMGSRWEDILQKLGADAGYARVFKQVYPNGIARPTVQNAIAEFERSLSTPNARFDRWLRGDDQAITREELDGYRKFKSYGCTSCHQGVNVGGNMFETLGAVRDYFADRGNVTRADLGRFNVTGREEDRHVFKVPSLRNVALTPPYFHDGSVRTLDEAVQTMARYQLGRPLPDSDRALIVQFLHTLTGEYDGRPL